MGGVEWGDVGDQVQMVGVECGWETGGLIVDDDVGNADNPQSTKEG